MKRHRLPFSKMIRTKQESYHRTLHIRKNQLGSTNTSTFRLFKTRLKAQQELVFISFTHPISLARLALLSKKWLLKELSFSRSLTTSPRIHAINHLGLFPLKWLLICATTNEKTMFSMASHKRHSTKTLPCSKNSRKSRSVSQKVEPLSLPFHTRKLLNQFFSS